MIYDLNNILDKERFKRRCNALYKQGSIVSYLLKRSDARYRKMLICTCC